MGRPRRKPPTLSQRIEENLYQNSDARLAAGGCLICGAPAVDASHQVPEVSGFIGSRITEDELAEAARKRLKRKEGCITWPLAGFSLCWRTKMVGAAGDTNTERRLQLLGFRK